MQFKIKEYLNIDKIEVTTNDVYQHLINKLVAIKPQLLACINELKNHQTSIYPLQYESLYLELRLILISICMALYKMSGNIIFTVKAEDFFKGHKVCSLDIFIFYLSIFINEFKCSNSEIIKMYEEIIALENFSYKIDIGYCLGLIYHTNNPTPTDKVIDVLLR